MPPKVCRCGRCLPVERDGFVVCAHTGYETREAEADFAIVNGDRVNTRTGVVVDVGLGTHDRDAEVLGEEASRPTTLTTLRAATSTCPLRPRASQRPSASSPFSAGTTLSPRCVPLRPDRMPRQRRWPMPGRTGASRLAIWWRCSRRPRERASWA